MKLTKKILSLVLVVLMTVGFISTAHAEEGDSQANAIPFTISAGVKGNLSSINDTRWYKVDLGSSFAMATFNMKHDGASTSAIHYICKVYAEDDLSTPVTTFTVKGDTKSTSSDPVLVMGGIYYLTVSVGTTFVNMEYTVSVTLKQDLKTESEDNNDKANADDVLTPSKGYSEVYYGQLADKNDVDYFKFKAPKGFFQVDFAGVKSGITYNVKEVSIFSENPASEFYTEQTIGEMNIKSEECAATEKNPEGYVTTADIGVAAGTYYIRVSASGADFTNANYRVRIYVEADDSTEQEFNGSRQFADELKLPGVKFGSISFNTDTDFYKFTTKADATNFKITIKGGSVQNDDSATWNVNLFSSLKSEALEGYPKTVDMKKPVEIDLNGYEAGTYYLVVSKGTDTKGNYIITTEKYDSNAKPAAEGNFFSRVWARIKALPWGDFWNNNFRELVLNLGGTDGQRDLNGDGKPDINVGMFSVLKDLFTMSFGTIFKVLNG